MATLVDGFMYSNPGEDHHGEIVEIVARVTDRRGLEDGPAFFIRFIGGEVGLAVFDQLNPWFPL